MRYPVLVVSDLHLTANDSDDYRWGLFPWMIDMAKRYGVKEFYILGDLTDAKDRHTSLLVNKLVGALSMLARYALVKIIKGNHDYIDADSPFLEFVNSIPNIEFYSTWTSLSISVSRKTSKTVLFLPHTRSHGSDWAVIDFQEYDFIFMHQTVNGSLAANGFALEEGMSSRYFGRKVYSGDIHVPQTIGDVEYIGAPYAIRFGDEYKARALIIDLFNGNTEDIFYKTISKKVLTIKPGSSVEDFELSPGDMVKIRIFLSRNDFHKWESIKKNCTDYLHGKDIVVHSVEVKDLTRVPLRIAGEGPTGLRTGISNRSIVEEYTRRESVGDGYTSVGIDYL